MSAAFRQEASDAIDRYEAIRDRALRLLADPHSMRVVRGLYPLEAIRVARDELIDEFERLTEASL